MRAGCWRVPLDAVTGDRVRAVLAMAARTCRDPAEALDAAGLVASGVVMEAWRRRTLRELVVAARRIGSAGFTSRARSRSGPVTADRVVEAVMEWIGEVERGGGGAGSG